VNLPNDCGEHQEVFIVVVYYFGNLTLDLHVCLKEVTKLGERLKSFVVSSTTRT
jgi:hypothetical protein